MSIIFIGTPEFAVPPLRHLADSGFEIKAVITQPDRPAGRGREIRESPVKHAALSMGFTVLQPASLRDEAVIQQVKKLQPAVMVTVAYGRILRPEFLAIAPNGVVNVHPSLLPRYRGASPIQSAIIAGDSMTGVTIMLMDSGMDSGPILAQERMVIAASDTGGSLSLKLAELGADLLVKTLTPWLDGRIEAQPQDEVLATVTRPLRKEDGRIDWAQPAVQIEREIRAYDPWPGSYTTHSGEKILIWGAAYLSGGRPSVPGEIRWKEEGAKERIVVSTGDGLLELLVVQREGRKRVSAVEFARGVRGLIGSRLG